jgi:hypothetical protein
MSYTRSLFTLFLNGIKKGIDISYLFFRQKSIVVPSHTEGAGAGLEMPLFVLIFRGLQRRGLEEIGLRA